MAVPTPTVRASGPLFDGRAQAAAAQFVDAAEEEIATEGVNDVRSELGAVLRNPTGFYESQIQTDHVRDDWVVDDGGVVYGPWLAGVGSRNAISSFKGYQHWRRAAQQLSSRAEQIAERVLPTFLRRMN